MIQRAKLRRSDELFKNKNTLIQNKNILHRNKYYLYTNGSVYCITCIYQLVNLIMNEHGLKRRNNKSAAGEIVHNLFCIRGLCYIL